MKEEEIAEFKKEGFMLQKDKERLTCRIVFPAGIATAEELAAVSEIAKKYGDGTVVTTVRLNMELPNILPENVEEMKKAMDSHGLHYGGTGANVRPLVGCKGTVCKFGQVDTQALVKALHEEFYGKALPHKFKINVTGCVNNCAKVQLNDVGFMGAPKNTLRLYIGGCFGRKAVMGREIGRIPVEKAAEVVRICLDFFSAYGKPKQRFFALLEEMEDTPELGHLLHQLNEYTI